MAIKQHDNEIYTKEYNEPIERYLRNIIQRYFEIENDISQETKEAIIIQAYTRLKEVLNAYTTNYIICVNEKSGAIDLHIRELGGEKAFDKKNAFNKDFCPTTTETKILVDGTEVEYLNYGEELEDYVVSGDDDRLSDARIPLMHLHDINQIDGLQELLDNYRTFSGQFHLHKNHDVLEMIIYTGHRARIDLKLLEDLLEKTKSIEGRLEDTNNYFINVARRFIDQLYEVLNPILKRLSYIDDHIEEWSGDWVTESELYTDSNITKIKNDIKAVMKNCLTVEEFNTLKKTLSNSISMVTEGYIDLDNNFIKQSQKRVLENTSRIAFIDTQFDVKHGYTNILSLSKSTKNISNNNILNKFYNNNINNGLCKFFLEYTKDGVAYRDQLPHLYHLNNSRHDNVLIYGDTDSNNNINIYAKRISMLPVYMTHPLIINATVEDNTNKFSDTSYFMIDDTDTTYKSNNYAQNTQSKKDNDTISGSFSGQSITFTATAQKTNNLSTWKDQCLLHWDIEDNPNYTYRIQKRANDQEWTDLVTAESFSSSDTAVLQRIYDNGHIYRYTGSSGGEITTNKEEIWRVDSGGVLSSAVNESYYDVLLTRESYTTYRHRATLTVGANDPSFLDNDTISIIISAVKINNVMHTLSLACMKQDDGMPLIDGKCYLVSDLKLTGADTKGIAIASFEHGGTDSTWTTDTKISFDIRKDKQNLIIRASDFYTLAGYQNYDSSRVKSTPVINITFAEIETLTGIDYSKGMIGYGNYSQKDATVVGINLETYNSYIDGDTYLDTLEDTLKPKMPKIKAKCNGIKSNGNYEYQVIIDSSDSYEKTEYKLSVYDAVNWAIDTITSANNKSRNSLYELNPIFITSFSGVKKLYYQLGTLNNTTNTLTNQFISRLASLDEEHKEITVSICPTLSLEDNGQLYNDENRIIFCDNTRTFNYLDTIDFLSQYNCYPFDVNSQTEEDYIKSFMLPAPSQSYNQMFALGIKNKINYHDNSSNSFIPENGFGYISHYENTNGTSIPYTLCYYGCYELNNLKAFMPDAKVKYQLFRVPSPSELEENNS